MADFETSGSVRIEIDQQSLREAQDEVESTIGSVAVGGAARADGGAGRGTRRARRMVQNTQAQTDELQSQTALLEDVVEILDDSGAGGGSGGGGGGLGLGGFAGGAAASQASAPSGRTAGIGLGLGLGLLGVRGLQETGVTGALENAGQFTRENAPGGEAIGDAAQLIPGLSLGTAALDIAQGDLSFSRTAELQTNRIDVITDTIGEIGVNADAPNDRPGSETAAPLPDGVDEALRSNGALGNDDFDFPELPGDPNNRSRLDELLFKNGSRRSARELLPLAAKGRLSGDQIGQLSERGIFDDAQLSALRQTAEAGELRVGPIRDRLTDTGLGNGLSATPLPAGVVGAGSGGGATTVSINAPVTVDAEGGNVERRLDQRLSQLKQDILAQIPSAVTGGISREQQNRYQRGF